MDSLYFAVKILLQDTTPKETGMLLHNFVFFCCFVYTHTYVCVQGFFATFLKKG